MKVQCRLGRGERVWLSHSDGQDLSDWYGVNTEGHNPVTCDLPCWLPSWLSGKLGGKVANGDHMASDHCNWFLNVNWFQTPRWWSHDHEVLGCLALQGHLFSIVVICWMNAVQGLPVEDMSHLHTYQLLLFLFLFFKKSFAKDLQI